MGLARVAVDGTIYCNSKPSVQIELLADVKRERMTRLIHVHTVFY